MHTTHPHRRPWRSAALASAALGVGSLAAALPIQLAVASSPPDTSPSGNGPADPGAAGGTIEISDADVADAKAALEQWLAEHALDAGTGAAAAPDGSSPADPNETSASPAQSPLPTLPCPILPDENLDYFAEQAGLTPDAEPSSVEVADAAVLAPDLSTVDPDSGALGVACTASTVSGTAATVDIGETAGTDVTAQGGDSLPAGSISLEGDTAPNLPELTVVATSMDDSEFAAAITAADPDAVVTSPDGAVGGELVGHCDTTIDRCQAWWHQDGLVIGITLAGVGSDVTTAVDLIDDIVPSAIVSLVATGEGTDPSIPAPPPTEPAEPPFERIEIPEGETSTSVTGSVDRGAFVPYAFAAGAGQQVDITLSAPDGNATFDMFTPGGELIANDQTTFSGTVPEHGDYLVQVGATTGSTDFELGVSITGEAEPPPAPDGGPIQIPPGETSATVDGSVDRGQFDTWTFRAAAGQQVDLTVSSPEGNATFDVFSPSGELLADDQSSFSGTVPADGDYALEVGATSGTADYTIDLSIV